MEFNKPPEWGTRFQFPENVTFEYDGQAYTVENHLAVKMAERYEKFIVEQIAMEAKAAGVSDITVLNKEVILKALEKQIPKKPAEAVDYECCIDWMCPTCGRFHRTEWQTKCCSECGQAIDWRNDGDSKEVP